MSWTSVNPATLHVVLPDCAAKPGHFVSSICMAVGPVEVFAGALQTVLVCCRDSPLIRTMEIHAGLRSSLAAQSALACSVTRWLLGVKDSMLLRLPSAPPRRCATMYCLSPLSAKGWKQANDSKPSSRPVWRGSAAEAIAAAASENTRASHRGQLMPPLLAAPALQGRLPPPLDMVLQSAPALRGRLPPLLDGALQSALAQRECWLPLLEGSPQSAPALRGYLPPLLEGAPQFAVAVRRRLPHLLGGVLQIVLALQGHLLPVLDAVLQFVLALKGCLPDPASAVGAAVQASVTSIVAPPLMSAYLKNYLEIGLPTLQPGNYAASRAIGPREPPAPPPSSG
mmetsp:Transcript_96959/g.230603  ORF Transcript_96959/g.230603 Transcript_96959/m.230603 type:complete len:340 (+) Transcript_96959:586-1605(+)